MTCAAERAEADRLLSVFQKAGARRIDTDILQSADTLLDLYGEDIRARAFTTQGPLGDELMLRPDFTVPVVQMHMQQGGDPARYAYAGQVFRRQEDSPDRPAEYFQVGFELFGGSDQAASDAEVFVLFHGLLTPLGATVETGDIGILRAAVQGLKTSQRRRDALLRHIWRPAKFRSLLSRFARGDRHRSTGLADPWADAGPRIGLRSRAEIDDRLAALAQDAAEPPIGAGEVALIGDLLECRERAPDALARLRAIAADLPSIAPAVAVMAARLDAIEARGIAAETVPFAASHGRSTMEYYDGFVFSFTDPNRPDTPVSTGGRYDALTRVLGGGRVTPAVGGILRPGLMIKDAPC